MSTKKGKAKPSCLGTGEGKPAHANCMRDGSCPWAKECDDSDETTPLRNYLLRATRHLFYGEANRDD